MKITEQDVRDVADLANLRLSEAEVLRMVRDLGEILTHVEKLGELDTSSVEPMAQVLYDQPADTTLRSDEEHEPLGTDQALANAPQAGHGHYKVPKVIER